MIWHLTEPVRITTSIGEPACGRMPYEPRFLMIRENAGGVYMAGKEADERSQYTGRKRSAAL